MSTSFLPYRLFSPLAAFAVAATAMPVAAATLNTQWQDGYAGDEANTVLLWKFDGETESERLSDASGNGLDAELRDATTPADQLGAAGKFGEALNVGKSAGSGVGPAGAQSQVNMTSGSFMGSSAEAFTLEFWYRPTLTTTDVYLIDNKADSHNNGISLRRLGDGELNARIGNGSDSHTLTSDEMDWTLDQWYHVALTFENQGDASVLSIWRDGQQIATETLADFGDLTFRSFRFSVGDRAYSSGTNGSGDGEGFYDEVRISDVAYSFAIPEPSTLGLTSLAACFLLRRRTRQN